MLDRYVETIFFQYVCTTGGVLLYKLQSIGFLKKKQLFSLSRTLQIEDNLLNMKISNPLNIK